MTARHVPVLLDEVMAALALGDGDVFVDATFGAGGYTRAALDHGVGRVFGIDRDATAIAGNTVADPRLTLIEGRFSVMDRLVRDRGTDAVDGVAMDVGVSSMQIDTAERGFSFMADGPLDMRMGRDGPTAADFVNTASEAEIADVLFRLGDEPKARRIARALVNDRPFTRTGALAAVVRSVCGPQARRQGPGDADLPGAAHPRQRRARRARGRAACGRAAAPRGRAAGGGQLPQPRGPAGQDLLPRPFGRRPGGIAPPARRHRRRADLHRRDARGAAVGTRDRPQPPGTIGDPARRDPDQRATTRSRMTGLKSTLFVAGALASIMACYTVALRASSERAAVVAARTQIAHDMTEMRLLRAELRTRSRLPELQRWNEQDLALAPPRAEQLMADPVMLASYAAPAAPTAPSATPSAAPATVATVVRDAPQPAPVLRQASFRPRVARDLGTDAALAGTTAQLPAAMPVAFRKVALR